MPKLMMSGVCSWPICLEMFEVIFLEYSPSPTKEIWIPDQVEDDRRGKISQSLRSFEMTGEGTIRNDKGRNCILNIPECATGTICRVETA
ncbi:MAG: hypothetical protein ABSG75_12505 [Syntrophales bacterium]